MGTFAKIVSSLVLVTACAQSNESSTTAELTAWDEALPALTSTCAACHGGSMHVAGLDFLAGSSSEEIRQTLLASGVIDFDDPYSSRILTKGVHEGPWFTAEQVDAILAWIESEQP
jgi:mono/diheme cytochrome c family protein